MALGKPKDGEGKLGSDTAEGKVGKLLICSLLTGQRKIKMGKNKHIEYVAKQKRGVFFTVTELKITTFSKPTTIT